MSRECGGELEEHDRGREPAPADLEAAHGALADACQRRELGLRDTEKLAQGPHLPPEVAEPGVPVEVVRPPAGRTRRGDRERLLGRSRSLAVGLVLHFVVRWGPPYTLAFAGISGFLVWRLEAWQALAKEQGAVLSVSEANQPARALYRSLGFTQTARRIVLELRHG